MLKPIKSILTLEEDGTGEKGKVYSKGFGEQIKSYTRIEDIKRFSQINEQECILRVEGVNFKEFITAHFNDI